MESNVARSFFATYSTGLCHGPYGGDGLRDDVPANEAGVWKLVLYVGIMDILIPSNRTYVWLCLIRAVDQISGPQPKQDEASSRSAPKLAPAMSATLSSMELMLTKPAGRVPSDKTIRHYHTLQTGPWTGRLARRDLFQTELDQALSDATPVGLRSFTARAFLSYRRDTSRVEQLRCYCCRHSRCERDQKV